MKETLKELKKVSAEQMLQEENKLPSRLGFHCFILAERTAKGEHLGSVARVKHFLCQEQRLKFQMGRLRLPRKRIKRSG